LTSGAGDDDFNFLKANDSARGTQHDIITDFMHGEDDIDFSHLHPDIKSDQLSFIGQGALNNEGDLHIVLHDEKGTANDYTMVEANLSGNRTPEIQSELTGLIHLNQGDILL
jgi:serralysin